VSSDTCAFVAVLLYDGSLRNGASAHTAWALLNFDASAGIRVENHVRGARASAGCALGLLAGHVCVEAGLLAVGAIVPNLIGRAGLASFTIVISATPGTAVARAGVALLFSSSSVFIVDSLVQTFAVSFWYALVQFFIDDLAWKTVASSDAAFFAVVWLNLSAS